MIRTALIVANTSPQLGLAADEIRSLPWTTVLGLSIIQRTVLTAKKAGFKRFLIVVCSGQEPLARSLQRDARLADVTIEVVAATDGDLAETLSMVRDRIGEPFVVLSGNHLCELALLETLRQQDLSSSEAVICIDRHIDRFPPDDVAKVVLHDGSVEEIGPELSQYQAIDTGIYLYSPDIPGQAEQLIKSGARGTLSQLNQLLIQRNGRVTYVDVSDRFWMRVRTAEDIKQAARVLFNRGGKPTDGIYATFNRQVVGQPLIRFFLKTPITPNTISMLGLLLGVLSGAVFAVGGYWTALLGAIIGYLSSIMDNVDGAVARLKHMESRFGTWLEMACDYTSYLVIFSGMGIGLYRHTGQARYVVAAGLCVLGTILSFLVVGYMRKKHAGEEPGSWVARWHAQAETDLSNPMSYFSRHVYFLTRRPVLPYYILIFTILNLTGVFLYLCAFGANLFWPLALYSNRLFKKPAD